MAPPAFDDDLRFAQGVEDLAIEQFVAKAGIKALDVAVLPRTAGFDVGGLGTNRGDPLLHGFGDKLWSIVGSDMAGMPRRMKRSDRTSMTSIALSLRLI